MSGHELAGVPSETLAEQMLDPNNAPGVNGQSQRFRNPITVWLSGVADGPILSYPVNPDRSSDLRPCPRKVTIGCLRLRLARLTHCRTRI